MSETQTSKMDSVLEQILNRKAREGENPAVTEKERKRALLARVRVLSDINSNNSKLLRNPSPDFNYIWAYNHVDRISFYEGLQAELVRDQDKVESNFKKADGTHVRGDTILMRMHKDLADAWNATRELKALEAVEGKKQEMVDWGEKIGIPVYGKN